MKRETLEAVATDLRAGRVPALTPEDVPAFSEAATAGDPHIGPETLAAIAATLTEADIPTFERALRALDGRTWPGSASRWFTTRPRRSAT